MDMKVTSLNLAGYKNWNDREANIVSFLDHTDSDIVFLQEVKYDPTYSSHTQSHYLNSLLRAPYTYTQSTVSRIFETAGKESREGLAVLSKFPITDVEVIVLAKRPDDKHTRIIQKIQVQINSETRTFTNIHFSNNDYSDEQLEETLQILKNTNTESVVLGDFNIFDITTVADLYADDYTASTEFTDYVSFPSENATFDYVLLPKTYTFTSLRVGENLSDHNALVFEFEV
jgi:endonuclease/exonuclease/phosphatase family metal-dependent hydrolase